MKDLKQHFTIKINEYEFVPHITEDDKYIYVEYINDVIKHRGFAITKSSHMGAIKRDITDEIYKEFKKKGLY